MVSGVTARWSVTMIYYPCVLCKTIVIYATRNVHSYKNPFYVGKRLAITDFNHNSFLPNACIVCQLLTCVFFSFFRSVVTKIDVTFKNAAESEFNYVIV